MLTQTILRLRINALAHFAAKIVVCKSVSDPLGYYLANAVKSRALIEAPAQAGVRHVIFSSTAADYSEPDVVQVPEDLPLNPINHYSRSKLVSERMIADASDQA